MTHLASSWELWKLQFLSGSWLTRALVLIWVVGMVIAGPLMWPGWGPILVPFIAIPMLWSIIAAGENEYRAFGMNRARAAAHSALTIVPLVIMVAAVLLVLQPTASGLIGAVFSVIMGAVCIYWSDPTETNASALASEGSVLPGRGGFAWRVLWRGALLGALVFGVVAGLAEILAYTLPWEWIAQLVHGLVPFAFWLWLAQRLTHAAAAWKAFGYTRRSWVRQFIPAGVASALLMAAVFAVVVAVFAALGWVPSGMDITRVLLLIAISTLLAISVSLTVASLGGDASWFAFIFGMMAWFASREYFGGDGTVQTYLYFALIFTAVLAAIAGFSVWRLLTGRRTRAVGSDYLSTNAA